MTATEWKALKSDGDFMTSSFQWTKIPGIELPFTVEHPSIVRFVIRLAARCTNNRMLLETALRINGDTIIPLDLLYGFMETQECLLPLRTMKLITFPAGCNLVEIVIRLPRMERPEWRDWPNPSTSAVCASAEIPIMIDAKLESPVVPEPRIGMVCWSCKHFSFNRGSPDQSDVTPGWTATMDCGKSVWDFDFEEGTQEEFERVLKTAETCDKFEPR